MDLESLAMEVSLVKLTVAFPAGFSLAEVPTDP